MGAVDKHRSKCAGEGEPKETENCQYRCNRCSKNFGGKWFSKASFSQDSLKQGWMCGRLLQPEDQITYGKDGIDPCGRIRSDGMCLKYVMQCAVTEELLSSFAGRKAHKGSYGPCNHQHGAHLYPVLVFCETLDDFQEAIQCEERDREVNEERV
ncbi:hypothetical protein COU79_04460 [Candidatus Peregrinibacteria bacterium CG10_big_fil_rev_8_21_14_0_10_54_7]|nr:MAG: hypothetical protein COU79_04460 [Candidatus Peregrinibacteria bacterium CG10_big_fil_rev_8_21_14_0_10_54_7]